MPEPLTLKHVKGRRYVVEVNGKAWVAQLIGTRSRFIPLKYGSLRYRWLGPDTSEAELPENTVVRVVVGREVRHYLLREGNVIPLRTVRAKIPRMNVWGTYLLDNNNRRVGVVLWTGEAYLLIVG